MVREQQSAAMRLQTQPICRLITGKRIYFKTMEQIRQIVTDLERKGIPFAISGGETYTTLKVETDYEPIC